MRCNSCNVPCDEEDNYCRRCGAALRAASLPVVYDAYPPAPWQPASPLVARGVAIVAAGTLLELAARWLTRKALSSILTSPRTSGAMAQRRTVRLLPDRQAEPPADLHIVRETYIYQRTSMRR